MHMHCRGLSPGSRGLLLCSDEEMMKVFKEATGWLKSVSSHTSHSETRLMNANSSAHETLRRLSQSLDLFCPPPRGNWGWILRQMRWDGERPITNGY